MSRMFNRWAVCSTGMSRLSFLSSLFTMNILLAWNKRLAMEEMALHSIGQSQATTECPDVKKTRESLTSTFTIRNIVSWRTGEKNFKLINDMLILSYYYMVSIYNFVINILQFCKCNRNRKWIVRTIIIHALLYPCCWVVECCLCINCELLKCEPKSSPPVCTVSVN